MAKRIQSATSLDVAPDLERRGRMIRYSIAMTVRMVCVILAVFVQGWLMWLFFIGAIFLPYFAVVLANAGGVGVGKGSSALAPLRGISQASPTDKSSVDV